MDSLRTTLAGGAPKAAPFPPRAAPPLVAPPPAEPARRAAKPATCAIHFAWDDMGQNDFEWEAPVVRIGELAARAAPSAQGPAAPAPHASPAAVAKPSQPAAVARPAAPAEPGNARIRERYYQIRFPGAPGLGADADVSSLVKVARLYFEDGDAARAVELLGCASAALPQEERLPLAALEILFLTRQGEAFVEAARAFRERFPASKRWADIERLGWRFAPRERLFAGGRPQGEAVDERFGAWPESPNWIEAPWDLTCEVLAVELRGRVLGTARS